MLDIRRISTSRWWHKRKNWILFVIFLLRQYFKKIPNELWDAARLDGSSHLNFLLKVVIPMSKPIIVTVS